jgi:hypothetical protein
MDGDSIVERHVQRRLAAILAADVVGYSSLMEHDEVTPSLWYFGGWLKVWVGEPDVAIDRIGRALRLSPLDPYTFLMQSATAYAHFIAGRYAEAASWAEAALRDRPDLPSGLRMLAASSAMLGLQEQAGKRIRELDPTLQLSNLGYFIPLRQAEHRARLADGLKKAGAT